MDLPFAGIDGCRGGWVIARWDGADRLVLSRIATINALFRGDGPHIAAIDIPIGLPERAGPGGRAPERLVRNELGRRKSSVFSVPARAAVMAGTGEGADADLYQAACSAALATSDPPRKLSKQCFFILRKIAEVDCLLRDNPDLRTRLVECHPELSFCVMNGRVSLDASKKSEAGIARRLALLGQAGVPIALLTQQGARALGAGLDDLIDACACAVTAKRVFDGKALRFPDPPERDAFGLPVVITA